MVPKIPALLVVILEPAGVHPALPKLPEGSWQGARSGTARA